MENILAIVALSGAIAGAIFALAAFRSHKFRKVSASKEERELEQKQSKCDHDYVLQNKMVMDVYIYKCSKCGKEKVIPL